MSINALYKSKQLYALYTGSCSALVNMEADSVCGEGRQVRKCYWAEMVRVAGEDRPDLSCHSPDAPCSLVPGLDYPRILGMESRTWRITDRIVEDYNRYLWCFTGWRHEY